MKVTLTVISVFLLIVTIGAPPVVEKVNNDKAPVDTKADESDEVVSKICLWYCYLFLCLFKLNNLEYGRYLKEVVEILENDPEFKRKIENASIDDIKVLNSDHVLNFHTSNVF